MKYCRLHDAVQAHTLLKSLGQAVSKLTCSLHCCHYLHRSTVCFVSDAVLRDSPRFFGFGDLIC
jgi:hypothetical protein